MELIVVLALIGIVAATAIRQSNVLQADRYLDLTAEETKLTLDSARLKAVLGVNRGAFGVHFEAPEARFTLFQGPSFSARNAAFDEIHTWPPQMISYAGPTDILFNALTGSSAGGTITLTSSLGTQRVIHVYDIGRIE